MCSRVMYDKIGKKETAEDIVKTEKEMKKDDKKIDKLGKDLCKIFNGRANWGEKNSKRVYDN